MVICCSNLQLVGSILCLVQIGLCPISPRHVVALQSAVEFLLVETWNFLDKAVHVSVRVLMSFEIPGQNTLSLALRVILLIP